MIKIKNLIGHYKPIKVKIDQICQYKPIKVKIGLIGKDKPKKVKIYHIGYYIGNFPYSLFESVFY